MVFYFNIQYTDLSSSAQFFHLPEKDLKGAKQLYHAARDQWFAVSSRMAFEYFIQLTYMLGTGESFKAKKGAMKKYKKWLKEDGNPYSYFAINVARAIVFDRTRRTPEVHAGTNFARRILLMSATEIDNDNNRLIGLLRNQWQFIIDIINNREPNGWAADGQDVGDNKWYELLKSGNHDKIVAQMDKMFSKAENGVGYREIAC